MDIPPDLVRAAQSGDREAMEDLIARSYRPAYSLAYRLLGDQDEAAEATQEAYVRVVRSLKGFRAPEAFPTWLFRIVSNVCMSQMRKRSRRDIPTDLEAPDAAVPAADLHALDAEDVAVERIFRQEVDRCIAGLPDAYRTVVMLRDVYEMSGEEVAGILGISSGAVKVRLHRARKRLRGELLKKFPDWGRSEGLGDKESA